MIPISLRTSGSISWTLVSIVLQTLQAPLPQVASPQETQKTLLSQVLTAQTGRSIHSAVL